MKLLREFLATSWAVQGMFAWVLIGFVKMFAVSAQLQSAFGLDENIGVPFGFILSLVPLLGGVLAYMGASGAWGWPFWLAALLFLIGPATTALAVMTGRGRLGAIHDR